MKQVAPIDILFDVRSETDRLYKLLSVKFNLHSLENKNVFQILFLFYGTDDFHRLKPDVKI